MTEDKEEEIMRKYVEKIIESVRKSVKETSLDLNRLPRWINAANIIGGVRGDIFVFLVEQSDSDSDNVEFQGEFNTDAEFFFPNINHQLSSTVPGSDSDSPHTGFLGGVHLSSLTLRLSDEAPNIRPQADTGDKPNTITNAYIEYQSDGETIALRNIPLALLMHRNEIRNISEMLTEHARYIVHELQALHDSEVGDKVRSERRREEAVLSGRKKSVVVLGSYKDEHYNELKQVRDIINTKDYRANLISELPGVPDMSNSDKVKNWTTTARFCVLIDRVGGGENNEFEILKSQEKVVAVLRPQSGGSTSMMGHESLVNRNDIEFFEFDTTPLEVVDEAVTWAESIVNKRGRWRRMVLIG
jgi:hypothetical protein